MAKKEIIESIEQTDYGCEIKTTHQIIEMGIRGESNCCEIYGYMMSEDNLDEFIGAWLLGVKLTDTEKNVQKLNDLRNQYEDEDHGFNMLFVDFETNRGVFQFVAYNGHNGYYGHDAYITSRYLKHEERI